MQREWGVVAGVVNGDDGQGQRRRIRGPRAAAALPIALLHLETMAMVPAAKGKAIFGELEEEEACKAAGLSNDVKELESEVARIKLLLGTAQTGKIQNEQLVRCLQELKQVQYDGEDVLDELSYYCLKQQIEGGYSSMPLCTSSSHLWISDVLCVPDDKWQGFPYTTKEIIRQSREITVPVRQALKLDRLHSVAMSIQGQSEISSSRLTGSYVDESKVYGRDGERDLIIELMTSENLGGLTVLPMVGNGGVGKTTLAQLVSNDPRVKCHFVLKMWVCVSHNFDLVRLTHEMLDCVTEEEHGHIRNFDKLQQMLKKNTQSRRFLLILDDVWDISDKWDDLLAPLKHNQAVGSFVLVTTRDLSLAQAIGTVDHVYLDGLQENDFWLLFKSYAFGDEKYKGHRKLQAIGREIACKLKGYPLGAKTVGALLRKNVTVEHWSRILRDEEWKFLQTSDSIIPALKLSYDHMARHLQECFSYCSLFPKNYKFHEAELVQMWISQDFVHSSNTSKRLEEIGAEYLADLVNFGFFQQMNGLDMVSGYCVMHDLMHDLACLVSANECVTLDGSEPKVILPGTRHLSITCYPRRSDYPLLVEKIEKQLYNKVRSVRKLRTLMLIGVCNCCFLRFFRNIFGEAQRLRLLLLKEKSGCSDRACAYPDYSICDVLNPCHLRYLNLSTVQKLGAKRPNVTKFYNIQVLDGLYEVDYERLCNLVNLRHLGGIHRSIAYVGRMTRLQELHNFSVQNAAGFDIGQIELMNELVLLRVSHLENIRSATEARRARLIDKSHLDELSLSWHGSGGASPGLSACEAEADVLEALEPHRNLKHLRITGYMGVTSPSWLACNLSFASLQTIRLENCPEWLIPPSLGEMQALKKLALVRMPAFKEVLIPYLEELVLIKMSKLETCVGPDEHQKLPSSCLKTLHIEKCSKLAACLLLQSWSNEEGKEIMECFSRLRNLTIRDCPRVTVSACPLANRIPYMNIRGSSKIPEICRNVGGFDLSRGEVGMVDDKVSPFGNQRFTGMRTRGCPNVLSLALSEMTIEDCPNFLPPHEGNSTAMCFILPSLKRLKIGRCGIAGKWISQMLSHTRIMFMLHLTDCPNVKLLLINCPVEEAGGGSNLLVASSSGCPPADECVLEVPAVVCSSLSRLHISNCPDLVLIGRGKKEGGFAAFRSLKELEIRGCPGLVVSSMTWEENGNPPLPLSLQKLDVDNLPAEVVLGENMGSLKRLSIWESPRLRSLQLHYLSSLEFLDIKRCEQLALLEGLESLSSLEILDISIGRDLSTTWDHETRLLLPPCLQNLGVWDLTDDIQSRLLPFLPSLIRLWVYDSPGLMSLQLGSCTALECLTVTNCGSLSSLEGLQHIRDLKELAVSDCPILIPQLELALRQPWSHGLCSRLKYVTIDDPSILAAPICKRLTSLSWFTLGSYYFVGSKHVGRMVGLTEEHEGALQFLTSLNLLQIENCPNLLHLPRELHRIPCLEHLTITNCPGISRLPEKGLPPSLISMRADGCSEELNEQCRMAANNNKLRVKIDGEPAN